MDGLNCTDFNIYGFQHCIAGINTSILDVTASDTQHATEWCWAASIEAVFHYYGHIVPQEEIVRQVWGSIVNMPGQPNQILSALNRDWTDSNGNNFSVTSSSYDANYITASQDLAADQPLIVGTMGHAMVLTALEYDRNTLGQGTITNAYVRDPWPYNPRRRSLSPVEWLNINFLARIRVSN